jgi:alpha-ketoglutarate-dependent 2,4-dichlorophenoxyacetate dioxygenase
MIVTQLHPHFMAEITGLDLSKPMTHDQAAAVQQAIDAHAVLVFRDQAAMDDEAQIAFSALFGPLQRSITVHREDTERRLKRDELSDISNVDDEGRRLAADDRRRLLQRPARLWHTDSSFRDPPGRYTFLAARMLPPEGGNTEFADMRAAYDALDDATRARIAGLRVHHSLGRSRILADAPPLSPDEARNLPGAEQPLVRRHPAGRDALYLASHAESITGWPEAEGRALLDQLTEHAIRPEFVYSHAWRDGDFVMWDNRCTMHRATPFREDLYRRDMRRTTVADG